jgi:hypothetical protein
LQSRSVARNPSTVLNAAGRYKKTSYKVTVLLDLLILDAAGRYLKTSYEVKLLLDHLVLDSVGSNQKTNYKTKVLLYISPNTRCRWEALAN